MRSAAREHRGPPGPGHSSPSGSWSCRAPGCSRAPRKHPTQAGVFALSHRPARSAAQRGVRGRAHRLRRNQQERGGSDHGHGHDGNGPQARAPPSRRPPRDGDRAVCCHRVCLAFGRIECGHFFFCAVRRNERQPRRPPPNFKNHWFLKNPMAMRGRSLGKTAAARSKSPSAVVRADAEEKGGKAEKGEARPRARASRRSRSKSPAEPEAAAHRPALGSTRARALPACRTC